MSKDVADPPAGGASDAGTGRVRNENKRPHLVGIVSMTRAVQLLGAATGAAVGLTTAVFAWAIDILVWPEHILPLRLVGLALALMPALWAVAFASLQRPRDGSPGGSAASR